jgi:xylan 1,4-beta-xylosidase
MSFDITLNDYSSGLACLHIVDARHGNPLNAWEKMGRPNFPTPSQQQQLRQAAQLPAAIVVNVVDGRLRVMAEPNALIVIQFINLTAK